MIRTALAGLVFGYGAAWAVDAAAAGLDGPVPAQVERVIDGDTIAVRALIWLDHEISVRVRLAGIDAPEGARADCPAEKARAEAATAFLAAWVEGR
ncbi:MAG: nuclease, partial [Pseudomonadota bacterium]